MPRLTKVEELTLRISDLESRLNILETRLHLIHEAERKVITLRQKAIEIELELAERGERGWTEAELRSLVARITDENRHPEIN